MCFKLIFPEKFSCSTMVDLSGGNFSDFGDFIKILVIYVI